MLGIDKDYYEVTAGAGGDAGTGGGMSTTSSGGGSGGGIPASECNGGDGVCLAAIPIADGWSGYFSLYSANFGQGSECPSGPPATAFYSDPSAVPATCSPCACDAPVITCQGHLDAYVDSACAGAPVPTDIDTICNVTGQQVNGVLTKTATTDVTCEPSGGVATEVGPTWTKEHRLCDAGVLQPGDGCMNGESCVAKELDKKTCIKAEGAVAACPAGWEGAARYQYFLTAEDTRGCEPCFCTPPMANPCGGGTYSFFDTGDCAGGATYTTTEGTSCLDTFNSNSARYDKPGVTSEPCTEGGGAPSGQVNLETVAATVCCRN